MTIATIRFGQIEVPDDRIILFPCGIMPFTSLRWFALIELPSQAPFAWLQSLEEPALVFLVVSPHSILPDYAPRLSPEDLAPIEVAAGNPTGMLVILTLDSGVHSLTANLMGPIAVNWRRQRAVQVILRDDRYATKHPIAPVPERCAVGSV